MGSAGSESGGTDWLEHGPRAAGISDRIGTIAAKAAAAALNIHTFNTLYNYGYTNVYELGPLIDVRKAKLQFEGTSVPEPAEKTR